MIVAFGKAFLCTWIIETFVLILSLKSIFDVKKVLLISIFMNTMTLPFVWFFFTSLVRNFTLYLVIAELFAYFTEALLLLLITQNLLISIKTSILANTSSLLFGLLLF